MYYGGVFCFEKRMTSEIMQKNGILWKVFVTFMLKYF